MTFKSIDQILAGEAGDNARRFTPLLDPDESHVRDIIMPHALRDWCFQSDSTKSMNYKANVRAFLKRFVVGLEVDNCDYFKHLKKGLGHLRVFELRVQIAPPKSDNTRVFGAFVRPDLFMAVHQKPRSWFQGHPERWKIAAEEVVDGIQAEFPGQSLMIPKPFSNCVTAKAVDLC